MNDINMIGTCVWAAVGIAIMWLWCFIHTSRTGRRLDDGDLLVLFMASAFWPITATVLFITALCVLAIWTLKLIPTMYKLSYAISLLFRPEALGLIVWRRRKENKKGAK